MDFSIVFLSVNFLHNSEHSTGRGTSMNKPQVRKSNSLIKGCKFEHLTLKMHSEAKTGQGPTSSFNLVEILCTCSKAEEKVWATISSFTWLAELSSGYTGCTYEGGMADSKSFRRFIWWAAEKGQPELNSGHFEVVSFKVADMVIPA